jgi:hypothetical protein
MSDELKYIKDGYSNTVNYEQPKKVKYKSGNTDSKEDLLLV